MYHILKLLCILKFINNLDLICIVTTIAAQKGNLTEKNIGIILSLLLSVPSILGVLFLLLWQTYVLRVDVVLAGIELGFIGLEMIMGIVSMINFAR